MEKGGGEVYSVSPAPARLWSLFRESGWFFSPLPEDSHPSLAHCIQHHAVGASRTHPCQAFLPLPALASQFHGQSFQASGTNKSVLQPRSPRRCFPGVKGGGQVSLRPRTIHTCSSPR